MKKIILIAITAILAFGFSANIMAASNINENEQKIITAISDTGYTVDGKTVILAQEEINEAKNFFMRDDINLTAEDANTAIKGITDIGAVMKAEGVTKFTDLSKSGKQKILDIAKTAVAAIKSKNLAFSYDSTTKMASILDRDTSAVLSTSDVTPESTIIKQTGTGLGTTYLVAGAIVLAAAGSFIVARKTNLLPAKSN